MAPLLEIRDLHVHFFARDGVVKAVNGLNLKLEQGEVLGLLGESGSGKTVTALTIMGLLPYPGKVISGEILYRGKDLLKLDEREMREIRAKEIAIAFQDPVSALNPRLTIGVQLQEVLRAHGASKQEAQATSTALLHDVGLPEPERIQKMYPFQVSGGMAQRVMMAIAMSLKPSIILADELTTNLDVTLQADMLVRLKALRDRWGTSIVFITHDMAVLAQLADQIAVMYAGTVVEGAPVKEFYRRPLHPYSWGMFQARPRLDRVERLMPIPGMAPDLRSLPDQCPFLPRCFKAITLCRTNPKPPFEEKEPDHNVRCYNPVQPPGD